MNTSAKKQQADGMSTQQQQPDSMTGYHWSGPVLAKSTTHVIYGDHYNFRNDLYDYSQFPYDDLYFESYHYMDHGSRNLPPIPMHPEPEPAWFKHDPAHGQPGCWVRTFVRGMGFHMKTCDDGETYHIGKCFDKCKEGYHGVDNTCFQDCGTEKENSISPFCPRPRNYGRDSTTQAKEGYEKIGLKYFSPCKEGFRVSGTQCIGKCPDGSEDAGWFGCRKHTYERESKMPTCPKDSQVSGSKHMCYERCPGNTRGHGPFCFGTCPEHTQSCFGIACLPAGHKCTDLWEELSKRVQRVIDAGMQTSWSRGMLHIGQLIGDTRYPTCPTWE